MSALRFVGGAVFACALLPGVPHVLLGSFGFILFVLGHSAHTNPR